MFEKKLKSFEFLKFDQIRNLNRCRVNVCKFFERVCTVPSENKGYLGTSLKIFKD